MKYNPFGDTASTYHPEPAVNSEKGSWVKAILILIVSGVIIGSFVYYSSLSQQREDVEDAAQEVYSTMYTLSQSVKSDEASRYISQAQEWLMEDMDVADMEEAEKAQETIERAKEPPGQLSFNMSNSEFGSYLEPYVSMCVLILSTPLEGVEPPETTISLCNELDQDIQEMSTFSVRYNEMLTLFGVSAPFFQPVPLLVDSSS